MILKVYLTEDDGKVNRRVRMLITSPHIEKKLRWSSRVVESRKRRVSFYSSVEVKNYL